MYILNIKMANDPQTCIECKKTGTKYDENTENPSMKAKVSDSEGILTINEQPAKLIE